VRDSSVDDKTIRAGDFLGLLNGKIETVANDLLQTSRQLLEDLLQPEAQVLTIFKGQDATDEQLNELKTFVEANYPEVEVEVQNGGQPLYFFIFAAE
jgi:dihydroxyacetone kinase-like predicted kinase